MPFELLTGEKSLSALGEAIGAGRARVSGWRKVKAKMERRVEVFILEIRKGFVGCEVVGGGDVDGVPSLWCLSE